MIVCFTGTGNSLFVARKLHELSGDRLIVLENDLLTKPGTIEGNPDRIIWVFPTYSWGVPPVVIRFIREATVEVSEKCDHFMVTTCGDDIGNCHKMWRNEIKRRGWKPMAAFSVTMPNTYVNMTGFDVDSPELEKKKIDLAADRIRHIANQITLKSTDDDVVRGSWPWVKTSLIYPWFIRFEMSADRFKVNTGLCTSCGLCSRNCPTRNIVMTDGSPKWNNNCARCLRCYHICPVHAIRYGKATDTKGQYRRFISKGVSDSNKQPT